MKEFDFNIFKDSLSLQYLLSSFVDINFVNLNAEQRKELLVKLDELISSLCDIPVGNFIYNNGRNDNINDLFVGNLNFRLDGTLLLFDYLFQKRQQYQKICVADNNPGCYNSQDFNIMKRMYNKSPFSKDTFYISCNPNNIAYYFNYNNIEAHRYALDQMLAIVNTLDFRRIFSSYKVNEIAFQTEHIKGVLGNKLDILSKVDSIAQKKKFPMIFGYKLEGKVSKMNAETNALAEVMKCINRNESVENNDIIYVCFTESIWDSLSPDMRYKAMSVVNDNISQKFGVTPIKLLDNSAPGFNEFGIYVDNLETVDGNLALDMLCLAYAYRAVLNTSLNREKNSMEKSKIREDAEAFRVAAISGDIEQMNKTSISKAIKFIDKKLKELVYDSVKCYYSGNMKDIFGSKNKFVNNIVSRGK